MNGHTVEHFKVTDGGHTWPGSIVPLPENGNTCMDFNASAETYYFTPLTPNFKYFKYFKWPLSETKWSRSVL